MRISKGSQEVNKLNTELPMRSVQNPYEGMNSVTPTNDIPFGELTMRIGTRWLGGWHRARMERHPYLPPPLPCTEGYLPQFFFQFFQPQGVNHDNNVKRAVAG